MLTSIALALAGACHVAAALTGIAASWVAPVTAGLFSQYAPAGEVEHLGGLLVGGAFDLVLAVLGGCLAARVMHAARIHWSWAAVAGVAALTVHALGLGGVVSGLPLLGRVGWHSAVIGASIAAWRGARLQRAQEAQQSGLASGVYMHTPAAAVRALWLAGLPVGHRAVAAISKRVAASTAPSGEPVLAGRLPDGTHRFLLRCAGWLGTAVGGIGMLVSAARRATEAGRGFGGDQSIGEGSVLLGTDDHGGAVSVPTRHSVVVGASGAGKTVTMRRMLGVASAHMGVVAIDGKGDAELEADLQRFACAASRRFASWSPEQETRYNPFAHGSDTEIVDKALAAESWGDDYYLRLGQRFLGFAVRALRLAGRPITLAGLARYVDPDRLGELAPEIESARTGAFNELIAAIPALDRGERQAIAGTQHRLAAMAESDVGVLLEPAPGHPTIDLLESVVGGDVAYFNLSADSRPALSRMVGAAVIRDLVSISATLISRRHPAPTVLMLDDIQAFATDAALGGIASLFARGRQAGMMLLLGTQSLADLGGDYGAGVMDQLMDSRATLVVHRLPGHRSALRASQELGDHEGHAVSEQLAGGYGQWRSRGQATRSLVQIPNVRPRELMDLPTGVAVVKTTGRAPSLVHVLAPE